MITIPSLSFVDYEDYHQFLMALEIARDHWLVESNKALLNGETDTLVICATRVKTLIAVLDFIAKVLPTDSTLLKQFIKAADPFATRYEGDTTTPEILVDTDLVKVFNPPPPPPPLGVDVTEYWKNYTKEMKKLQTKALKQKKSHAKKRKTTKPTSKKTSSSRKKLSSRKKK